MEEYIENIINDQTTKVEEPVTNIKATDENVVVKYLLNDLIDNCKALGYKKEIVAGAFFNCDKKEMTKQEFHEEIKKFLGKKVK